MGFKAKNLDKINKGRRVIKRKHTQQSNTPTLRALTEEFQLMNTERMAKLENHHFVIPNDITDLGNDYQ